MTASRFVDPGSESPGFVLWKVSHTWQRTVSAALSPLDLTHTQFVMLACAHWLNKVHGHVAQVEVARQASVDPQMVSQILRRLEVAGLLRRTPDPHDARAKLVALTPAGNRLAVKAIKRVEAADAAFFGHISQQTLDDLRSLEPSRPATS